MDLKEHTLIAEYLGDVISTKDYLSFDNIRECGANSRFTLLKTDSNSTSLEIVPEFNANIERFLNTANLDEKDAKKRKF